MKTLVLYGYGTDEAWLNGRNEFAHASFRSIDQMGARQVQDVHSDAIQMADMVIIPDTAPEAVQSAIAVIMKSGSTVCVHNDKGDPTHGSYTKDAANTA